MGGGSSKPPKQKKGRIITYKSGSNVSVFEDAAEAEKLGRLVNGIVALFMLVLFGVFLIVAYVGGSKRHDFPVFHYKVTWDPAQLTFIPFYTFIPLPPSTPDLFKFNLTWVLASALLLGAISHGTTFLMMTLYINDLDKWSEGKGGTTAGDMDRREAIDSTIHGRFTVSVVNGFNPVRWLEYFFGLPLVVTSVAYFGGLVDGLPLLFVWLLSAMAVPPGAMSEWVRLQHSQAALGAHVVWWILMFLVWLCVLLQFGSVTMQAGVSIPTFAWGLVISECVGFAGLGIIQSVMIARTRQHHAPIGESVAKRGRKKNKKNKKGKKEKSKLWSGVDDEPEGGGEEEEEGDDEAAAAAVAAEEAGEEEGEVSSLMKGSKKSPLKSRHEEGEEDGVKYHETSATFNIWIDIAFCIVSALIRLTAATVLLAEVIYK